MTTTVETPKLDRELIAALVTQPERYPNLEIVKTQRKGGTMRRVLVYDNRLVIKQYAARPGGRWWRAYWRREHDALERLRGLPVPESYGYFTLREESFRSVLYARQCVPGEALLDRCDPVAPQYLTPIAHLMAQVHGRRVIANDYSLFNIRIAPDGTVLFIDFHRARVFHREDARYWIYLGKDLGHFYRVSCRRRADLFGAFLTEYLAAMAPLTARQERLILGGCRFWCWLKGEPGPPMRDQSRR